MAPNSVHVVGFTNGSTSEKPEKNVAMVSPTHYAVPKSNSKIRLVPDFHQGKHDMGEFLTARFPRWSLKFIF